MTSTTQKTKDELLSDYNVLLEKLRSRDRTLDNPDEIIFQMNANKEQVKELDKILLLKQVNAKYSRLRSMAKQAYECEIPTEDITTNDGSFHKSKVKKYPNIAALQYASASFKDGRIETIRINGEKFQMYKIQYEYGKKDVYNRPETFEAFLELNSIPLEDITLEKYNEFLSKLKALNDNLKEATKSYEVGLKSIGTSAFNYHGLASQHNVNLYEYTAKI